MTSKRFPLTLILGICIPFVQCDNSSCGASGPGNFSVSFSAEWNAGSFPKHYPTYRPPAQWSSLFGCTHKSDFVLWANGSLVSPGVKMFVEDGKSQLLIEELRSVEDKVLSWFQADPIPSGEGNTTTTITMETSHPFVSIIVRIIPSPDWFIGVNSLNLCENGTWRTRKLLDLFPWDAGTDSGFTFSSPNFETQPQEAVSQITATTPSHPANSFHYPRIKKLPRLGYLEFSLIPAETSNATLSGTESTPLNNEQISEECIQDEDTEHNKNGTESRQQQGNNTKEKFDSSERFALTENCGKSQITTPLDCEVSHWLSWGLCSHFCGNGTRQRTRYITLQPANGGDQCPTLLETETCEQAPCSTDSPPTSATGATSTTSTISARPLLETETCEEDPGSTDSPPTSATGATSTNSTTSAKPSTTPAPSKKVFNLKWIPSQDSRGDLWRSIYHRLLSRTKGFKNTTTYLHSIPPHST